MPRLADQDPPLGFIVTMAEAVSAGLSADQVRQRVRSGRWVRLARGVYRTRPSDAPSNEWEAIRRKHAERAIAEVLAHRGCFVGFDSAAVLHDLPLWRAPGPSVSLIAGPGGHNGRRPGVVVHRLELHERDVSSDPVPVTTVARTWLDVSRIGRLTDSLVLGDAALRAGLLTREDVNRVLITTWAKRGVRTAREAAKHLDGVRETPLESASWAYFLHHALPLPLMQVELCSSSGFIARVDFLWEDVGVVGEADGRLKYEQPEAIYAEKVREDAIRAEGYRVVRWGADALGGDELAHRLRRVLT